MLNIFGTEDFAFIRIDTEKFQLINSFFGMDEGDNLLKYMADYLQNVEKEYRYITYGRIEADIFAVCFSYEDVYKRQVQQVTSTMELSRQLMLRSLVSSVVLWHGLTNTEH